MSATKEGKTVSHAILNMEGPVCAVETCHRLMQLAISRNDHNGVSYLADCLAGEVGDLRKTFDDAVEAMQAKGGAE